MNVTYHFIETSYKPKLFFILLNSIYGELDICLNKYNLQDGLILH